MGEHTGRGQRRWGRADSGERAVCEFLEGEEDGGGGGEGRGRGGRGGGRGEGAAG